MASVLCECVFNGNLQLLRKLLRAGAPPHVGDYDSRTALHIAAAEGLTAAVRAALLSLVHVPALLMHMHVICRTSTKFQPGILI